MTEILSLLLLAVVQGLTEFLPVSSSGHLVLLHLGTLGSVLVVYRREVGRLLRFDRPALLYMVALAVGTLPAVAVGLLAKDFVEEVFHNPVFAAWGLLFTSLVLFSTRRVRSTDASLPRDWEPRPVPLPRAFAVGCAQALAILPGISRSGSTIAASLWLGIGRAEAARFSFLLSVPAILGALVLQLVGGGATVSGGLREWLVLLSAAAAAFAVGLLAIRWTALAVVRQHFWKFSFYVFALGLVALGVLWLAPGSSITPGGPAG